MKGRRLRSGLEGGSPRRAIRVLPGKALEREPRAPQAEAQWLLRQVPLFADLADDDLKAIAAVVKGRTYRRGQVIIRADEVGGVFFLLTSGAAKVSLGDKQGREVILKILYPFDFFGEMAFLDDPRRSATVTAVEKSRMLLISRQDFLQFIQSSPQVVLRMLTTLSQRLRRADQKIGDLTFLDASEKVAMALLELVAEQGVTVEGGVALELRLTRQALANLAGVARETLERVLAEFQRRGWVRLEKRRIVVFNPAMLRREAYL
ncbi:MAG: Crp/Fnr family transcriptional regulator [candidate division NC10 bacterium]|nr:Crp/Fnr family transcriptional regulator [candidate division NC10 bacterium]